MRNRLTKERTLPEGASGSDHALVPLNVGDGRRVVDSLYQAFVLCCGHAQVRLHPAQKAPLLEHQSPRGTNCSNLSAVTSRY